MRMLFATTAGVGHFGPLVPLARAARDLGHEVRIAAPASFEAVVRATGVEFSPLGDRSEADAGRMFERIGAAAFEDRNAIMIRDGFGGIYARAALPALLDLMTSWRPNVVVREEFEYASLVAADVHDVPRVAVATGTVALEDYLRPMVAEPIDDLRTLAGAGSAPPGVDRAVLSMTPRALDRPDDEHRVRRYRVGDAAASEHLAEPSPRVYLTFGSEAPGIGFFPDLYRAAVGSVVAGVAEPSIDLLVSVGRAADPAALEPLPPGVRVERWVDQDEALSRVDVTVCHGGYGTVVGSLAAGVPLVVLPLFAADQWINAEAAARAGVAVVLKGPEDIGQLGAAVARVLADGSYRERARAIQSDIASLPGPSEAVGWIEAVAS